MKIKDIINEAFGTRGVRDPYTYDYEKDPETGEYTGRQETNPRSFTNMISGVADRLSSGSGSQWIKAPDDNQKERVKYYNVPKGRMLFVRDKNGRVYFKYAAKPGSRNPTGYWTDQEGRELYQPETVEALEKLARQSGQLTFDPNDPENKKGAQAQAQAQEPAAETPPGEPTDYEPSTSEPLHPDVSIMQSVPLVMQYKGRRFEMDDYGKFHPFGTTRAVTDALQTFLTKERMKL